LNPHPPDSLAVNLAGDNHSLIGISGSAEVEEKLIKFAQPEDDKNKNNDAEIQPVKPENVHPIEAFP
jgi:hypothetical protein